MSELNQVRLFAFRAAVGIAIVFCFIYFNVVADTSLGTVELEHRINPNDAPAESLARLPGIGLTRANAIVKYRQELQQNGQVAPAFRDCSDLQNVMGIGSVTAGNMCEWLKFQ